MDEKKIIRVNYFTAGIVSRGMEQLLKEESNRKTDPLNTDYFTSFDNTNKLLSNKQSTIR